MKPDMENMKVGVQETLDQLLIERLIPFELTAYKVDPQWFGEYVVGFCDSRIRSITFSWTDSQDLKEAVRAAVLDRTQSMWASYEVFRESLARSHAASKSRIVRT